MGMALGVLLAAAKTTVAQRATLDGEICWTLFLLDAGR
jgi:hypothetical protein